MLVLSRKIGEKIRINDNIVLTIVDRRGDNVRLGIDAPRDIPIHREEIAETVAAEERRAAAEAKEEEEVTETSAQPTC
jgi:carbon storage regulator